jgi:hypothetical protein
MFRVLPLIGYFIVLMSIVDISFIVLPLQLQNPAWELATIGSLADNFWAMLIGFGFILTTFFDEDLSLVKSIEITIITILRWFLLIYGILFILTIPLVIANTNRIADFTTAKITEQSQAKETLITNLEKNLNPISNPQQLMEIGQSLGIEFNDADNLSVDELRVQLQQQLTQRKAGIKENVELAQKTETQKLWKRSVRIVIQVIIISTICILVFFKTREIGIELL